MSSARLAATLEDLERRRQQLLRRFALLAGIVAAVLLLAVSFVNLPGVWSGARLGWHQPLAIGLAVALAALLSWGPASEFRSEFKQQVVSRLLRSVSPELSYSQYGGMTCAEFNATGLFSQHANRFESEDYITGTIGSTALVACEVEASHKTTNSKGESKEDDIFTGLLFKLDFNKNFSGYTLVAPDNAQAFLGGFGQILQGLDFFQRGSLVKLEDPEFERLFCVYSTDQVEARYLLSPSFMQRLVALQKKADGDIRLCFHHNHLFLALEQSGFGLPFPLGSGLSRFEPRWFRSLLDPAHVEELERDLSFVAAIVDELNLNTRIWSKA